MHLRECAEATTWALTQALREAELNPSSIRAQSELTPRNAPEREHCLGAPPPLAIAQRG